jgi:hypothetical protein
MLVGNTVLPPRAGSLPIIVKGKSVKTPPKALEKVGTVIRPRTALPLLAFPRRTSLFPLFELDALVLILLELAMSAS